LVGSLLHFTSPISGSFAMSRTPRPQPNRALDLRWGTEVQTLAVDWLWEPWLARGVVAVLDGDPGLGKSSVALDLVARVTTARPFPGADIAAPREPQTALVVAVEDSIERVVKPRLEAAGADLSRVVFLDG